MERSKERPPSWHARYFHPATILFPPMQPAHDQRKWHMLSDLIMCANTPLGAYHIHTPMELFLLTVSKLHAMHIHNLHQTIYHLSL